jgi:hypothetical protein
LKLNFPDFEHRIEKRNKQLFIFDPIRKKWVVLQPEEWVRQNVIQHLIHNRNFPLNLIGVEKQITPTKKRFDIMTYKENSPAMLIECKAPDVPISQKTIDQIASYLEFIPVNQIVITNGITHFTIIRNNNTSDIKIIKDFLFYEQLI